MLTGSSCSGKSTLAFAVAERFDRLAVHDTDESGVPDNPDRHWRNHNTEEWLQRGLDYQADGVDLLLTGQAPLGEILAAPSAPLLNAVAVCLVDVADEHRRRRLVERHSGPGRAAGWTDRDVERFNNWAAWHRAHARDPRHRPDVLTATSAPGMAWHRWSSWTAEDSRWQTRVIDTTDRPLATSVAELAEWIAAQRELQRSGRHPLRSGWERRARSSGPAD